MVPCSCFLFLYVIFFCLSEIGMIMMRCVSVSNDFLFLFLVLVLEVRTVTYVEFLSTYERKMVQVQVSS